MTKKMIDVIARDDVKYALNGKLKDALKEIQTLIEEHGEDATLDIDRECEAYSDHYYAYARIYVKREETDQEFATRLTKEAKRKAERVARDKAEYERLKKEFGE